jgi:hypothetical protein
MYVTSGVHQGTALDPILFLMYLYVNDFCEYIEHSTLRLLADKCIIYKTIRNKEDTQKLLVDLTTAAK